MPKAKKILRGDKARQALFRGVEELAESVVTTLGPKGRNVALDREWGAPNVIHDGVSVAKEIYLKDPFENMGAQLIREAASKTNDKAGDGTTTATLLTHAIVKEGLRHLSSGANPMILKKGIDKAVEAVIQEIRKDAKPIKTKEEIAQIATISAANEEIGGLIADALDKVGKDGVVTVEDGAVEMGLRYTEGMEFDKGYASPYFVTDTDKMEADIKDPFILVTDKRLSTQNDIVPFISAFKQLGYSDLVIIADNIDGEALAFLIVNKLKGILNVVVSTIPGYGDQQKGILQDIATVTGAKFVSNEKGDILDGTEVDGICGKADRVVVGAEFTRFIGGNGDKSDIADHAEMLRGQIKKADAEFKKEQLQERLAKITSGVAVVEVGAATEIEMKDRKERVRDAISATKAAIDEGIVPGGGIMLWNARYVLPTLMKKLSGDEKLGAQLVFDALIQPIERILANAGESPRILYDLEKEPRGTGYDVITEQKVDMITAGIVDPAKVTRLALENAGSVASMILTTDVLVTDDEDDKPSLPAS